MPSPKVIQLRQALSEKFPGLRLHLREITGGATADSAHSPAIEELLGCGQTGGGLIEIVCREGEAGSASLMREMIRWSAARHRIIGLVDGADSFDVTGMAQADLAQLLWVRCATAETAMKAADLLLRDGNLNAVILDLKSNSAHQLRKIPATTWYRFQRLIEVTSTVCLVITPRPIVASASMRLTLRSNFSLADLWRDPADLLHEIRLEPAKTARTVVNADATAKIA